MYLWNTHSTSPATNKDQREHQQYCKLPVSREASELMGVWIVFPPAYHVLFSFLLQEYLYEGLRIVGLVQSNSKEKMLQKILVVVLLLTVTCTALLLNSLEYRHSSTVLNNFPLHQKKTERACGSCPPWFTNDRACMAMYGQWHCFHNPGIPVNCYYVDTQHQEIYILQFTLTVRGVIVARVFCAQSDDKD